MIEQPFLRSENKNEFHCEQLLLARNRIPFLNTGVLFLAGYGESFFLPQRSKPISIYQPYWSFQLMTKGTMELEQEGKGKFKIKKGDFFLTRPGNFYHFQIQEEVEKRYIMVSHGVLVTLLCEQGFLADQTVITGTDPAYIGRVFDTIQNLTLTGGEDMQKRLSGITYDFLLHLIPENTGNGLPGSLSYIIEDIHANITEHLTLKSMSLQYGIGERTLNRLFLKYLNCTPIQYVIRTRMMYARQLLQSEGLGIENIARVCGYKSSAFFSKEFKRLFSCTPGEYRKQQIISEQKVVSVHDSLFHKKLSPQQLLPQMKKLDPFSSSHPHAEKTAEKTAGRAEKKACKKE